jgi:hypothetical protein
VTSLIEKQTFQHLTKSQIEIIGNMIDKVLQNDPTLKILKSKEMREEINVLEETKDA